MTEIPEDILNAVRSELDFEHFAYEDQADYEAGYASVARLILAERERCVSRINELTEALRRISEEAYSPIDDDYIWMTDDETLGAFADRVRAD